MAHGADGLATETAQHHPVLYFVLVVADHLEERIDAHRLVNVLTWHPVPKHVFLVLSQGVVRGEDWEVVVSFCPADKLVFPLTHLFTAPAYHRTAIDAEFLVGNHQTLVDSHHLAEAFAFRTGANGGIEREQMLVRFLKSCAVCLVTGGEDIEVVGGGVVEFVSAIALGVAEKTEHAPAIPFIKGCLGGVHQAVDGGFIGRDTHAVHHNIDERRDVLVLRMLCQIVVDTLDFSIDFQTAVTFLDVHLELLTKGAVAMHHEWSKQHELGAWLL